MSSFATAFEAYGRGRLSAPDALADPVLAGILRRYRRGVTRRIRIREPANYARFLPKGRLWATPWIDGQLWFLVKSDAEVALLSHEGRVLQGVPVVDEAVRHLEHAPEVIIPGELFALPEEAALRPRLRDLEAALADPDADRRLGFKAFDLLAEAGEGCLDLPYGHRHERLEQLLRDGQRVAPVACEACDADTIEPIFRTWVGSGKHEALVVRSEIGQIYKIREPLVLRAVVVGYSESYRGGVYAMTELCVAVVRDSDASVLQIVGAVDAGFTEQDRLDWRYRLEEMRVESSFRMANREGTLVHFVRPEIVIELKAGDLSARESSDDLVQRRVLRHEPGTGYEALGRLPMARPIHPVFVRERDDLRVTADAVGIEQIWRYVPFAGRDELPQSVPLPDSEIVARRVWTKELRGDLRVRKAVLIETRKADLDPRWPPWVIHFTDYSPARKTPLQTDLRVASSRAGLEEALEAWIVDNIKEGWEEVDDPAAFRAAYGGDAGAEDDASR